VRLFRRFILRRLVRERALALLTVCGIALGVAVVVAIRLANESSVRGFSAALDATSGAASLEIVGPTGGLDERRIAEIGWLAEYGAVSPVIEGDVVARPASGRSETMRVLGVDVLRERPFRDYQLIAVNAADRRPQELLRLLVDADAIVTTEVFARRQGLKIGDSIEVDIGDRRRRFTIRGLLRSEGPARVLEGNFILMDIAAAQWAFDRLGWLDRVEVRLADGRDVAAAERAIALRLPAGLSVQRPARRGEQVETMLRAFHFNLTALAHVALLVGLFLVYNTVAVSVIARRDEIGMLRALGASRRRVLTLFLGEAALLSIAGAAFGAAAGWLLARAAVRLTATTVNTLYIATAASVPALDWTEVGLAIGVSTLLSLAAAAGPALEASRVTPLAAVRGGDRFDTRLRMTAPTAIAGIALLASAGLLCLPGPVRGLPVFGFAAAVAGVFGTALLVPMTLSGLARIGSRLLGRVFGIEGRLAHANLSAAIPRLSVSVAALSVALAMMVAIAIMIASFRQTVVYWVSQTLQADLYLSAARRSSLDSHATISPSLERIVRSTSGVEAVDPFRTVNLTYEGRLTVLGAGDFDVLRTRRRLLFKEPRDAAAAVQRAAAADAVLVSEAFAIKAGKHAGDHLRLETPAGPRTFLIAAVYYDYTTDRGVVVMDDATFARHYGESRPASLAIYVRAGVSPETVQESMLQALGDEHRVFIRTNRSLRAEVLRVFDSTFAITYALEAIAIVVAIMGVAGTLFTLILERRADLAILRMVGAGRRQVRRMVVVEAGVIGLVSQALGTAAGIGLALILVFVVNVQSFGWTIQFHLPAAFLVQMTIVMTLATSLAGVYPARLAARAAPVERDEA
jgi:putative ABC transport system permease protein